MGDLLLPVGSRRMSSWRDHQLRTIPSSEPGTDWYCPIGTPVLAPADGVIFGYGSSIVPATGRWIGVDFTELGLSFRGMHFVENRRTSGRVFQGDVIALSGASGYGKPDWSKDPATGGAHVHGTLWERRNRMRFGYSGNGRPRLKGGTGDPYTLDFMNYVGGPAGGNATPLEDDMPTVEEILDFNVPRQGDGATGTTNLRQTIAWLDNNLSNLARLVEAVPKIDAIVNALYNTPVARQGGGLGGDTTLAATLAWLDSNLAALRDSGAVIDEGVLRDAVTAAVEKALAGTTLDPINFAEAVREKFRTTPLT